LQRVVVLGSERAVPRFARKQKQTKAKKQGKADALASVQTVRFRSNHLRTDPRTLEVHQIRFRTVCITTPI